MNPSQNPQPLNRAPADPAGTPQEDNSILAADDERVNLALERIWFNPNSANQLSQELLLSRLDSEINKLSGSPELQDGLTFAFLDSVEVNLGPDAVQTFMSAISTPKN